MRITKAKMAIHKNKETNKITNLNSMNDILEKTAILTNQLERGLILSSIIQSMLDVRSMVNAGIPYKYRIKIQKDIKNLFNNIKSLVIFINGNIEIYNKTSDIKLEFNFKEIYHK